MHNFYSYPPPNIQPAHHFGGLFFGIYTFSIKTDYCTIFFTYFLGNNRVYCSLHKTSLFYSNLYFLRRIIFSKDLQETIARAGYGPWPYSRTIPPKALRSRSDARPDGPGRLSQSGLIERLQSSALNNRRLTPDDKASRLCTACFPWPGVAVPWDGVRSL